MTLPTCHVNDPIVTQKTYVVSRAPQWKQLSTFQYLPNCGSKNATSSSPRKGFLITPFRQLPNFLVGAYNPFEKCPRQIGSSPNTGENKNISNHHPVSYWLFVILDTVLPFCWLHQRGKLQIHNWLVHQNPDINIGLLKFLHKLGSTVDGWNPAAVDMVQ